MSARHRWLRRPSVVLMVLAGVIAATFAFVPAGQLACKEPYLTELSPDRLWRIDVCGRARIFAMPGSGSDAPGWIVLRDHDGSIRGVSDLAMLQLYGATFSDTRWQPRTVTRAMVFELPLGPTQGPFARWWEERIWRWRALLGLTPSDGELH